MSILQRNQKARTRGMQHRAFTLIEMLVVIGIIAVLVAIILPTIFGANRAANRRRTQADLGTVQMALDEYKKDFKDYPRQQLAKRTDHILGWALMGPFDQVGDGANGYGFRTMTVKNPAGTVVLESSGKVWGPYLAPEKFKVDKNDLLDRYELPIQYFVRWVTPGPSVPLFSNKAGNPETLQKVISTYDWAAGSLTDEYAITYLRKALGDDDLNDVIASPETLKEAPPYLLLSIGAKKKYTANDGGSGTGKTKIMTQFEKCDEVANVPAPQ